jgi:glycosyltransferase involved in cell wall biosynthesis
VKVLKILKILLVNSYYYPQIIGGAEISTQKLAEGLVRYGHEVMVLCTGENEQSIINGVLVKRFRVRSVCQPLDKKNYITKVINKILEIFNPFNVPVFKTAIDEFKPDIIHVNNIYGISGSIWRTARKMKIPILQTLRDYFLMCPRSTMLNKKNVICDKCNLSCRVYRDLFRRLSFSVGYVTAPSQFTLDLFVANGYFQNTKMKRIFNAIDYDKKHSELVAENKKEALQWGGTIKFVLLGRLEIYKGVIQTIEAFMNVKDDNVELNIIGEGSLIEYVKDAVNADKRIKYHGFLKEDRVNDILAKSSVMIIPSIWYEPFGRTIIDAYKFGMPVIGTKMGGIPEIIEHLKTGYLIEPKSKEQIMEAILFFKEKANISTMVDNCVTKLNEFKIEKQIEQFDRLYQEVISNNNLRE